MAVMAGTGLLSARARAQYAAMAAMRWRLFINGLHSIHGVLDLGATGIGWMFFGVIGVGAGLGLGAGGYSFAQHSEWRHLPVLFWIASVLWLMLPVFAASYQEQSDLGILLRFPVRLSSYFTLYLISGLMEASTIVGALCCFGIWLGIFLARPQMGAPLALTLAIFAAFNILLVRTVFAWIDRWLAQRKSREVLGAVLMVLFLCAQFFNPEFYHHSNRGPASPQQQGEQAQKAQSSYGPMLRKVYRVQEWLPAGLAARAAQENAEGRTGQEMAWLGLLGVWALAAGGTLALRLRGEYRGENLGWAPARTVAAGTADARRERTWTLGGSGACTAALEKEIRSLKRTLPLLWALGAPLLLVLVIGGLFRPGASVHSFPYALPLCVAYALLGFTSLFYNNLGGEGAGIQLLFLSPTPIRTVLLAKNLLHSVLFILVACAAVALSCVRLGVPSASLMAALGAWLLFALPCNLSAGNILSLTMPYRINAGRIGRPAGSQANALAAMLIQAGTLGVGAAVLSLCWSLEKQWLAVPIFLALAMAACFVWKRVLSNVDAMSMDRREDLIATLMKAQ
jgi:ABC-2 type transport system permease protein